MNCANARGDCRQGNPCDLESLPVRDRLIVYERWRDAAEHRLANGLAPAVEIELWILFIHRLTSEIIAT
jgi:hypothetical protein